MKKQMPLLAEPVPNRLCWECPHIDFSPGSPGYSDMTPGYDMSLDCGKGYWKFDPHGELTGLREGLTSAERCADFSPATSQEPGGHQP